MAVRAGNYRGVSAAERVTQRRARLLAAGLTVWADPRTRTTMTAICAEAGLSERYVYESFSGLEAVMDMIAAEIEQTSRAAAEAARTVKLSDFTDKGFGVIHSAGPLVERSGPQVRPGRPGAARPAGPAGHPAGRRREGAHPRAARPGPAPVRRDPRRLTGSRPICPAGALAARRLPARSGALSARRARCEAWNAGPAPAPAEREVADERQTGGTGGPAVRRA